MIQWVMHGWFAWARTYDQMVLWPSLKRIAHERGGDIRHARAAFALHAMYDPAWLCLGHEEIIHRIDELPV
jgi:hypothetical protein